VMDLVGSRDVGVVLLDLAMPHRTGSEILADLHRRHPDTAVIAVTGTNEVPAAVECMKAGAFDYLVKAVEESWLVSSVRRALEIGRLRRDFGDLKDRLLPPSLHNPDAFSEMPTRSAAMRAVFLLVESVARSDEPTLVTGETGVAKKLVAEAAAKLQRELPCVPAELLRLLEAYRFPGNIRELRSMVYDAVARSASGARSLDPFRDVIRRDSALGAESGAGVLHVSFPERLPTIREAIGLLIEEALTRAGGGTRAWRPLTTGPFA
jgi:DNA-binding NtrC family response regulator